jgi:FkbM family methyltransferase
MELDFLEIGTSDFNCELLYCNNKTTGISIEPIKFYLDNLPEKENVIKINCAISDKNGEEFIYYVSPEDIEKYKLPDYLKGCNCVGKIHPVVKRELKLKNIPFDNIIKKEKIQIRKIGDIIKENNVKKIKLLKLDTEGYDYIILRDYINLCQNHNYLWADKLIFEINREIYDQNTVSEMINILKSYQYHVTFINYLDVHMQRN